MYGLRYDGTLSIDPQIVGSPDHKDPDKVPPIWGLFRAHRGVYALRAPQA